MTTLMTVVLHAKVSAVAAIWQVSAAPLGPTQLLILAYKWKTIGRVQCAPRVLSKLPEVTAASIDAPITTKKASATSVDHRMLSIRVHGFLPFIINFLCSLVLVLCY